MKSLHFTLFFVCLASCADKDASDPTVIGEPCDGSFTATLPDGSSVELGDCVHHGIDARFRHEATGEVKLRSLSLIFRGHDAGDEDCWVRWDQTGLCDQPYYPFDTETGTLTWSLADCPGLEDVGGGYATEGYVHSVTEDRKVVLPNESSAVVSLSATFHGASDGTVTLDGTFQFEQELDTSTVTDDTCAGVSGDGDSDGYLDPTFGGNDCDDNNSAVYPGAQEYCEGTDEDCDGTIDNGVTETYYQDNDEDGWGDPDAPVEVCADDLPDNVVGDLFAQDCDDTDDAVSPEAEEVCDGVDNDCDDETDEGC